MIIQVAIEDQFSERITKVINGGVDTVCNTAFTW